MHIFFSMLFPLIIFFHHIYILYIYIYNFVKWLFASKIKKNVYIIYVNVFYYNTLFIIYIHMHILCKHKLLFWKHLSFDNIIHIYVYIVFHIVKRFSVRFKQKLVLNSLLRLMRFHVGSMSRSPCSSVSCTIWWHIDSEWTVDVPLLNPGRN